MISAVRQLGELKLRQEAKDTLDVLIHSIDERNYPHVILISIKGDEWAVDLEECQKSKSDKLLYRRGSPRGINYSPTAMVTDLSTTFPIKLLSWFQKVIKEEKKYSSNDVKVIKKTYEVIERHKEAIVHRIQEKLQDLKGGVVLSVKVDGNYLKQIPAFVSVFLAMVNEKEMKNSAENQLCSVCGQRSPIVMAGSSAFKFYTIDKPGFITGHFDESHSWRNYPVCPECNLLLQEGKRLTEEQLRFRFYGLSYLLIPEFIFDETALRKEILDVLMSGGKNRSLQDQAVNDYIGEEDEIFEYLQDASDHLVLNLLFMQKVQSAERILLLVEDVVPSRLNRIFEAKKKVERRFPYRSDPGRYRVYNFGRLRTFFQKSDKNKRDNDLDKYFLEITNAIFRGQGLNIRFLTTFMMKEIRKALFEENGSYHSLVTDAVMNVLFLEELEILIKGESVTVNESQFETVFQSFGSHLNRPEKRGLFLLGALTQLLLRVQFKKRQAQPFLKQLKGLKMNEKDFLGLLPKVQEKLQQYDSYDRSKQTLAGEVSYLLLSSRPGWKMTVDEMNFYFVSGMNLCDRVSSILYPKHAEKTEEEENE
jgi:CRISPR-associated protein Csh1